MHRIQAQARYGQRDENKQVVPVRDTYVDVWNANIPESMQFLVNQMIDDLAWSSEMSPNQRNAYFYAFRVLAERLQDGVTTGDWSYNTLPTTWIRRNTAPE